MPCAYPPVSAAPAAGCSGSNAKSPIERERDLSGSVFARFALGGALCNIISEGMMLPIYASKVASIPS